MERDAVRILRYWRDTLSDYDRRSIAKSASAAAISIEDVRRGTVRRDVVGSLWSQWDEYVRRARVRGKEAKPDRVPIAIGLLSFMAEQSAGKRKVKEPVVKTVLWLPAMVGMDGLLEPDGAPWIARGALEPSAETGPIVAEVDAYDVFVRDTVFDVRNWADVVGYVERLASQVLRGPIEGCEQYGFTRDRVFVQIYPGKPASALWILGLYDAILRDYAATAGTALQGLWKQRALREGNVAHTGSLETRFALGESQRHALGEHLGARMGEITAVNGPPGTGKTTLIHAVVAHSVVEAALVGGDPSVLLAVSTNNQAITNIQDTMARAVVPEGHFLAGRVVAKRWLPDIESYALYLPAQGRVMDQRRGSYARVQGKVWDGIIGMMEDSAYVERARIAYLDAFATYSGHSEASVDGSCSALRTELVRVTDAMRRLMTLRERFAAALEVHGVNTVDGAESVTQREETVADIAQRIEVAERLLGERLRDAQRLDEAYGAVVEEYQPRAFEILLGWCGVLARSRWDRVRHVCGRLHVSLPRYIVGGSTPSKSSVETWLDSFGAAVHGARAKAVEAKQTVEGLHMERERVLRQDDQRVREAGGAAEVREEWRRESAAFYRAVHPGTMEEGVYDDPQRFFSELDTHWRAYLFHLAARYWEGRWLLEMERLADDEEGLHGQDALATRARFRRFSMVTPLLVSTCYTAPKYFAYFDRRRHPLFGFADVVIVDEAGQVPPDVGAPIFALGKRALVFGDVQQLEPIPDTLPSRDAQALADAGLRELPESFQAAAGSAMGMARWSCSGGVTLVEHRRSLPEIVAVSNELAYDGEILPLRSAVSPARLPVLGYAHVDGQATAVAGSMRNVVEATVLAEWLARHRDELVQRYSASSGREVALRDVVAVIAPFRAQVVELQRQLSRVGLSDLEVGTVHSLQGAERSVILFSLTYSHGSGDGRYGFVNRKPNLLNVAVSRGRDAFVLFGDVYVLQTGGFTGVLGRHLFARAGNAIADLAVFPSATEGRKLTSAHAHRDVLDTGLTRARSKVLLAGPYVRPSGQRSETLVVRLGDMVKRGIRVMVVVDAASVMRQGGDRAGYQAMERAGVEIRVVQALHGSVLCVDDELFAEGSFAWLGVDSDVPPSRDAVTSLVVEGGAARAHVERAWRQVESLGQLQLIA